jgi:micrococcal nuclease
MFRFPKFRNPLRFYSSNSSSKKDNINNINNMNNDNPINTSVSHVDFTKDGDDIKWEDTIPFTFPIQGGRVIKVYDGDTITIAAKLPYNESPLYRLSVRLNGIDTPEIKGKNEDEKSIAKKARDASAELVLNKYITLKNVQSEKYGRILADVYLGDLHLNEWLIKQRYAVKYDGGTKISPTSWVKYHLTGEL